MPAVLQQWTEVQEENRRIKQLQDEVAEITGMEVMDVTYRKLIEFLADQEIQHISQMDYTLRQNMNYICPEL